MKKYSVKEQINLIDGFKTFNDALNYLQSKEFVKDLNRYDIELCENFDIIIRAYEVCNYSVVIEYREDLLND